MFTIFNRIAFQSLIFLLNLELRLKVTLRCAQHFNKLSSFYFWPLLIQVKVLLVTFAYLGQVFTRDLCLFRSRSKKTTRNRERMTLVLSHQKEPGPHGREVQHLVPSQVAPSRQNNRRRNATRREVGAQRASKAQGHQLQGNVRGLGGGGVAFFIRWQGGVGGEKSELSEY